jgi:hypothetical protein
MTGGSTWRRTGNTERRTTPLPLRGCYSKMLKPRDRDAAYAQAAAVVACVWEVRTAGATLPALCRSEKDFASLAQLDAEQSRGFQDLLAGVGHSDKRLGESFMAMVRSQDKMVKSAEPFQDPQLLHHFVVLVRHVFAQVGGSSGLAVRSA